MIIEQVEALKTWLTNKLSPICDAEPSALAKYVCALVKKDKSEQELRDICVDQLDVFLQQNTKPFVDELFEVLKSKVYIPPASELKPAVIASSTSKPEIKASVVQPVKERDETTKRKFSEISSTTDDKENKESLSSASAVTNPSLSTKETGSGDAKDIRDTREPRALSRDARDKEKDRDSSRDRRDSWRDEKNRDGIRDARDIIRERVDRVDSKYPDSRGDTREVREPRDLRDRDHRERDRDFRVRRRSRSRSISPRRREFDERRRRYDERPRYSPERRWARRRTWSRSPRRLRSPLDRGLRARSRSPRPRSRSPRDRYTRSFRTRSRSRSLRHRSWSRSGSPNRLRTRSPSNTRQPDSRGSTPLQDNDFISSSTNDHAPAVTSTVGFRASDDRADNRLASSVDVGPPVFVQNVQNIRRRCQNFEEKGYCVLGDICPYDHGSDPVVVEDVSIPSVLPGSNASGVSNIPSGFIPPDVRVPPPGHLPLRINLQRPPPPTHVEPYLPEAPRLQGPIRPPFLRGPPDLHQPPPGMILNRPPPPDQFYRREVLLNRPPPEVGEIQNLEKEPSRIVIPAKRPYSSLGDSDTAGQPPVRMAFVNQQHVMFSGPPQQPPAPPQNQPPQRRGFDYSRLGTTDRRETFGRGGIRIPGPRASFKFGNLTLEVRKIPPELNNIAKLNEHFGKFGSLTNIQVKYQNDPGAALISFSNNAEATAAYRSPEPVFNNRFIKLFWHNPEKQVDLDGDAEGPVITVKDDGREVQLQPTTGGRVGDGIDHPSLMLPVRSSIPPAHKLQLDNTKSKTGSTGDVVESPSQNESAEKSIVYTSSVGNLKKTVFNSAATPPTPPKAKPSFVSPTAVKTADYVSRMEAIKRIEEDKKQATVKQAELELKKQELLAKQIEQQKILVETLEKKKVTLSEEEKKSLLKTLKTISDAIDKVKYGIGSKKTNAPVFQAPNHTHFKYVSNQEQVFQQAAVNPAPVAFGRGRGWSTGRGGSMMHRGRGRGHTYLDNRPKTVEVKGFDLSELDEIKSYFLKFGAIDKEELVEEVPSVFYTFAQRISAELAVAQGGKFRKKPLIVRWNQITPKISRTESTQSSEVDDDLSVTLGSLDEDVLIDVNSATKTAANLKDNVTQRPQEEGEDSRMFVESNKDELKPSDSKPALIERSLSEDLLAADEEHFKASYSDDDDDEDHITVTLSSTATTAPTIYTSGGSYNNDGAMEPDELHELEEELDDANTNIDFLEDGSWN
ncbi:RNA-binding protein 26-like isoform X1 [Biomphalaria glabrata]|uniref:RNA-binding protein 26-like isoform X1 n=1 Tax=Biomphalaria glabrata TaxID=6526 RepID=A0A9W3B441_BIOGL|nr:RNA-binding protein 26-like isoform X1 [Biomphalaria glabrata]